ncbi:Metallo-dependent phosphatase-like [Phytophthora cactorum]|nr:Metallo-dependent phosphatase-like [Phytophthora cactorum]KAF1783032.1 Metallo-dependent phosphatase-like [Phytophthora cactorum]KAF1783033.1 Metallo-dependent phosphatase-like [Phytophthora cactorum]KAF1783034.1 Metallo-dependent phosphatase-like [Phytophthora cactorum]
MHYPAYASRSCEANGALKIGYVLFYRLKSSFDRVQGIKLVYHTHAYERYPTANNKVFVKGGFTESKTNTSSQELVHVIAAITAQRVDNTHYGITTTSVTPTNMTVTMVDTATSTKYDELSSITEETVRLYK